jgi:hypothetical protein
MFSWSHIVVLVTKDRDMGEDPLKMAEAIGYLLWLGGGWRRWLWLWLSGVWRKWLRLSRVWGKWLWLSRVWSRWLWLAGVRSSWDRRCIGIAIVSL